MDDIHHGREAFRARFRSIDRHIVRIAARAIQVVQVKVARGLCVKHVDRNLAVDGAVLVAAAEGRLRDFAAKQVEGDVAALAYE